MKTLFDLLYQFFDAYHYQGFEDHARIMWQDYTVVYTCSCCGSEEGKSAIPTITLKTQDKDFEKPEKLPNNSGTIPLRHTISADVYDNPPNTNIKSYRTAIPRDKVNAWVRKVDEEATKGLREARYTLELDPLMLQFTTKKDIVPQASVLLDGNLEKVVEILKSIKK